MLDPVTEKASNLPQLETELCPLWGRKQTILQMELLPELRPVSNDILRTKRPCYILGSSPNSGDLRLNNKWNIHFNMEPHEMVQM